VTEPDATGPFPAAAGPRDAPPHAGQVVRRVLLRRNIVIDAETAQLVQAALQAGAPSRGAAGCPAAVSDIGRAGAPATPGLRPAHRAAAGRASPPRPVSAVFRPTP